MSPLRRLLRLPGRAARGAWRFVDPELKAGRIPYARTVYVMLLAGALVFVGYTLTKKEIKLPFSSDPYLVEVELPDAAGLDAAKEPAAGVAGAQVGRVVDVRYEDGQAVATLRLDSDLEGKVFADATASLRPINVLQVLIVNIEPGSPEAGPLPEGQRIEASRTDAFVPVDELTGLLDADTQAQVQVLIGELSTALGGRESELRASLAELGELTETSKPIARALDERRRLLADLVDNLDTVFTTLGRRGSQLAETIDAGSQTLAVTADRESQLAAATRQLAPTLAEAERSLAAGRELAAPLVSSLDQLLPVAARLEPAANKVRSLVPQATDFLGVAERLVKRGRKPVSLFEQGTLGLAGRVKRDLIPAVDNFEVTINALDKYKGGIAQTADLWSQAFSVNSNNGTYSQVYFGNGEISPQGLGLASAAAHKRSGGRPSKLSMMLARALERTCRRQNPLACEWRFSLPDLPPETLTEPRPNEGGE